KNTLYIIAGVVFCASAPLIRAQCDQHCDSNQNTALGGLTFSFINLGTENTAIGYEALTSNLTGGDHNTAAGFWAMFGDNTYGSTGSNNTATGYSALYSYTTG